MRSASQECEKRSESDREIREKSEKGRWLCVPVVFAYLAYFAVHQLAIMAGIRSGNIVGQGSRKMLPERILASAAHPNRPRSRGGCGIDLNRSWYSPI